MKATFTKAVRYEITAVCTSPFRTGGASGPDEILIAHNGQYIYQGSSLAGALRNWISLNHKGEEEVLFGNKNVEGSLIVSDGVFQPEALPASRPRVKINAKTGTQENLFSTNYLPVGSTFNFSIVWLGNKEDPTTLTNILEAALSAVNNGDIRLGGQKTNGFGRVKLTTVKKQNYDMTNETDRDNWLAGKFEGEPVPLTENTSAGLVKFTLSGYMESVLVRSDKPDEKDNKTSNITVNMKENNNSIIPASSIKGVVRARVSKIAPFAGFKADVVDSIFGRESKDNDNGVAGVVWFNDAYLKEKSRDVARIRINRFTGSVMNVIKNSLFTERPISSDVNIEVVVPENRKDACLLILYALRDLGISLYPIGSGSSVGRGYMRGEKLTVDVSGESKVILTFNKDASCDVKDEEHILDEWKKECFKHIERHIEKEAVS